MYSRGNIKDLIDILNAFNALKTVKKETCAILQSAISELKTLNEEVTKNESDNRTAFAKSYFIFLYALDKIPTSECVNINKIKKMG